MHFLALHARKYDVSEKVNHNRSNRINNYEQESFPVKMSLELDVREFSSRKISTLTVSLYCTFL